MNVNDEIAKQLGNLIMANIQLNANLIEANRQLQDLKDVKNSVPNDNQIIEGK